MAGEEVDVRADREGPARRKKGAKCMRRSDWDQESQLRSLDGTRLAIPRSPSSSILKS